ncbi:MAG: carboxypeptidase-like regulatory domain-containing protein [Terriglobales bacterium]
MCRNRKRPDSNPALSSRIKHLTYLAVWIGRTGEDKVRLFMVLQLRSGLIVFFAFVTLGWTSFSLGQTPQQTPVPDRLPGSISGTVVDQSGAVVTGARVKLTREDQSLNQEVVSGTDGQFSFPNIAPGPFQLIVTAEGFATQTFSGILGSGDNYIVPQTALVIAGDSAEVRVELSQTEVAEEEIKVEEKQRVLRVIPNFYVSYIPNAVPLTSKQKFKLAWKTTVDPFTFVLSGIIAGVEQAQNDFSGYGQGAQGYAKRYGAAYADGVTGTFIGSAILPSLLKQDPRYFYKGTGSKRSRILYAIANAVICKGDNGHWQANYSSILGGLAAGGISNLYYPAQNRNGAELTFETALIGTGASAAANLFQEFIVRKFTPKVPNNGPAKP